MPIIEFYQKGIDEGYLVDIDLDLMGSLTYNSIVTTVDIQVNKNNITENKLKQAMDYSWRAIAKK
jgi:hypothetical protein